MRLFIDSFLASVSHESGWLPSNILKWCLEADRGRNTAFAVSHLCQAMQLQSVRSDVEQLKQIHMQHVQLSVDDVSFSGDGNADIRALTDTEAVVLRQCMKNIARAIGAAFSPPVAGDNGPSEAVSTPMELLNLVIWQSKNQPEGLPAAERCLQVLQNQLGKGVDRSTLLRWLSHVRTFSLDGITGELLQDPNNQWVTSLIKEEIVLPSPSGGTGQRKTSHPPALLIRPPLASGDKAQQGHSGQVEYHLLQLVHQHEDSPLHSRYSSSLSNLALSPMLPFISENASADGACRLYFLPILIIRQPTVPLSLTSPSSGEWDSSSFSQSGPHLQLRCGDVVRMSPRLCSQLGTCGQKWDFETGQASAERDEQLMTFFGALLMVGPGASNTTGTEVWALLSDSLCRWWVYCVDLSSPLRNVPILTEEAGQSQEPRIALHHLLGTSAVAGSAHQAGIDPQLSTTLWQGRCLEVWKAVLGWLRFAGDRVVPPPRPPPVAPKMSEGSRPLLRKKAVNKPASSQQESSHATRKAQRAAAMRGISNDSAPVVHPQMEEQKDGEDVHFIDQPEGPRRSSRHANPLGDAVRELTTDRRSVGEEEEMKAGTRKEHKEAAKKAQDKAAKEKAKLAAKKQNDSKREQEEERKKEAKERKQGTRKPKKQENTPRTPKVKKREKPVGSKMKTNKRQRVSHDSEVTQRTQSAEVATGVLTRMRASVESTPAVSKQPAEVANRRGGKGRGKKRKDTADDEEKELQDIVAVEDGDEENVVELTNASIEKTPTTSAQPTSRTSRYASSPLATSGSSSSPRPHSPAASVDRLDNRGVGPHDRFASMASLSRPPPSLWYIYHSGAEDPVDQREVHGHEAEIKAWFRSGAKHIQSTSAVGEWELSGRTMDIMAEWDFLRQTRVCQWKDPSAVTALDRKNMPRMDFLAQCFVASVGLHDPKVRDGYFEAVNFHHKLTDDQAKIKGKDKAKHARVEPPWEKFKGITLTDIRGDRLDWENNPIENGTPSYPLGEFKDLDLLRNQLAGSLKAQQVLERKEERLPSPNPRTKKIKTRSESASLRDWGDRHHRHAGEGGAPPIIRTEKEKMARLQAENEQLRAREQARAGVAVLSPIGLSDLSVISDTDDSRSPSPFHQPLRSTNGPGRVAYFKAPIQSVAYPKADGVTDVERTSSSARRKDRRGATQFVVVTPMNSPHSAQPGGYSNYMPSPFFQSHPLPSPPPLMQPCPYPIPYGPVQQSLPPQPTYAVGYPAPHLTHSLLFNPYAQQVGVAQLHPSGYLGP